MLINLWLLKNENFHLLAAQEARQVCDGAQGIWPTFWPPTVPRCVRRRYNIKMSNDIMLCACRISWNIRPMLVFIKVTECCLWLTWNRIMILICCLQFRNKTSTIKKSNFLMFYRKPRSLIEINCLSTWYIWYKTSSVHTYYIFVEGASLIHYNQILFLKGKC